MVNRGSARPGSVIDSTRLIQRNHSVRPVQTSARALSGIEVIKKLSVSCTSIRQPIGLCMQSRLPTKIMFSACPDSLVRSRTKTLFNTVVATFVFGFFGDAGFGATLEEYRLDVIAYSADFPTSAEDPSAQSRTFGVPQLNNAGQTLYSAHWRGGDAQRHSILKMDGTTVARSGDKTPDYGALIYALGSSDNFTTRWFNDSGEVFFYGAVAYTNGAFVPSSAQMQEAGVNLGAGLWKGHAGAVSLYTGSPINAFAAILMPAVNPQGIPYSGQGVPYYSLVGSPRISDSGLAYFGADVSAIEGEPGNAQNIVPVLTGGSFDTRLAGQSLTGYPSGPAPGMGAGATFHSFGPVFMGQQNGVLVVDATVQVPVSGSNPIQKEVFYEYRNSQLTPFYVVGDPLPDIPPVSELVGSNYELRAQVLNVDEAGNAVFFAYASATNILSTQSLGYWKKTTNGLAKVIQFGVDTPTIQGTVRFPAPSATSIQRVTMADGHVAFATGFTGLGYNTVTRGVFRETDGGLELVAVAGMDVGGTGVTLGTDFAAYDAQTTLWLNATNEVAYFASYRTNVSSPLIRGVWLHGRDGKVRRVIHAGQSVDVGGSTKTLSTFVMGTSVPMFNKDALMVFTTYFSDGTAAIVRAVPQEYAPPPTGQDFYYTGAIDNNWHSVGSPLTNWEDSEHKTRLQPPGDAEAGTATVFVDTVPGGTLVLDQRPTSIGSLTMRAGYLDLREHLTLNQPSILNDLRMEAPKGALTANAATTITNSLEWASGTLDGPGPTSVKDLFFNEGGTGTLSTTLTVGSNANFDLGTFVLSGGTLFTSGETTVGTGVITNVSGGDVFQNAGLLVKEGADAFTVYAPYFGYESYLQATPWGIEVDGENLSLLGGGQFLGRQTNTVNAATELTLAGTFNCQGDETVFTGDGTVRLGTPTKSIDLHALPLARIRFENGGNSAHLVNGAISGFTTVTNLGTFYWEGGHIATNEETSFANVGDLYIETAPSPLSLEGQIHNKGRVVQRGALSVAPPTSMLSPRLENSGGWLVTQNGAAVTGSASDNTFLNLAGNLDNNYTQTTLEGLYVVPQLGGAVDFNALFGNTGLVDVNYFKTPGTTLNLPYLGNVSAGRLSEGSWRVHAEGAINTPNNAISQADHVDIEFLGGTWPQFQPVELTSSAVRYQSGHYTLAGPLDIETSIVLVDSSASLAVTGNLIVGFGTKLDVDGGDVSSLAELQASSIVLRDTLYIGFGIVETGSLQGREGAKLIVNGVLTVPKLDLSGAEMGGIGTLNGDAVLSGLFSPGSSPGKFTINGNIIQTNTSVLSMEIAGTAIDQYDRLLVSSNASLAGTLSVNLLNGFRPASGDTFPIIQAGLITGQFANASNGQRIATIDGYGTVVVNYTSTAVVLSAFQANPNPPPTSAATLMSPMFSVDGKGHLKVTGSPGREYVFQTSADLINWSALETNNVDFNGVRELQFVPGVDPYRFFRAIGQ